MLDRLDALAKSIHRRLYGNGTEPAIGESNPPDDQDVTPYEMRIANMRHDAHELLAAAKAGEIKRTDTWSLMTMLEIQEDLLHAVWAIVPEAAAKDDKR